MLLSGRIKTYGPRGDSEQFGILILLDLYKKKFLVTLYWYIFYCIVFLHFSINIQIM